MAAVPLLPAAVHPLEVFVTPWAHRAPVVDGVLDVGEWPYETGVVAPGDCPAMFYAMNDARTLYAAIVVTGGDAGITNESGIVEFEDEGGAPPLLANDAWDAAICSAEPRRGEGRLEFHAAQFIHRGNYIEYTASGTCTTQGDAGGAWANWAANDSDETAYEFAIPLDGGSALQASPGDELGFGALLFKPGCNAPRFPGGFNYHTTPPSVARFRLSNFGCGAAREAFGTVLPRSWNVETTGTPLDWRATDIGLPFPCGVNVTGGTGTAACAAGQSGVGAFQTDWTSPPFSLADATAAHLTFRANFQVLLGLNAFDVEVSDDDGSSWQGLLHWTESHGAPSGPGVEVDLDLAAWAASASYLRVRFRFGGPFASGGEFVQIDDLGLDCGLGLFADGFESGLTTHWSVTAP